MRATVRDVAIRAGVSPKTVSNVINGVVAVRPATRARVEAALAELDYVPNLSARGLRNGRTGVIALAFPDLGAPYAAETAHWFVELAHDRGWAVQLEQTGSAPERERDLVSRARAHLVDGLVLNPVRLVESAVAGADGPALPPLVVIGEVAPGGVDVVRIDSVAGARETTEYLLALGHRRIAVVGATAEPLSTATAERRLQGHLAALDAAGVAQDPALVLRTADWTSASAATLTRAMLAATDDADRPDAVFAFTDTMAIGVLHALREAGLRVPEDVSVVGFDDVDASRWTAPPLTTTAIDKRAFAGAALDLLEQRITDRDAPARSVVVPHTLVERQSSAAR